MGFGWMFFGYVFLLTARLDGFDVLPDVIGFLIMLRGFSEARKHCRCFDSSFDMCRFGIFISSLYLCVSLFDVFGEGIIPIQTVTIINFIYTVFIVGFNVVYLMSLKKVADETGVMKIRRRAATCVLLAFLALLTGRVLEILGGRLENMPVWMYPMGLVLELLFCFYVLYTTFSSYMWICLEGDEDMPDNRKHKFVTPFDIIEKCNKSKGGRRKK